MPKYFASLNLSVKHVIGVSKNGLIDLVPPQILIVRALSAHGRPVECNDLAYLRDRSSLHSV